MSGDWELFLGSLYLSAAPAAVAVLGSLWAARAMGSRLGGLGGGLRRREQLPEVRAAIEAGMRLAALFVLLYAALLALLLAAFAQGRTTLGATALHLVVFAVVTAPFGLRARRFERRLQALDTAGAEPGVAEVYARWLREWKQARLRLSEP